MQSTAAGEPSFSDRDRSVVSSRFARHLQSRRLRLPNARGSGFASPRASSWSKRDSVRVGSIRQDPAIAATIRVDDLLGKHFAILGTTGTGKSCTTALILRSIQQRNPAAHILLLDPHNQYASSFVAWGEVISPRNMQLPYWLLTFEELIEVLIGNPQERKAEIEILQELIPLAKCRTISVRARAARGHCLRRRRDPAGVHQVRRTAGARHAAQLQRPLHGDVAKAGRRRRLPR